MGKHDEVSICKSSLEKQHRRASKKLMSRGRTLDDLIKEFSGSDFMNDDCVHFRDAVYTCFSLQGSIMDALSHRFDESHRGLFVSMYGFYFGASEALRQTDGIDAGSLRVQAEESNAFQNLDIDLDKFHPHQYDQFRNVLIKALRNPLLKKRKTIGQLSQDYFEMIRDKTANILTTSYYAGLREQLNLIPINYAGVVVKGMQIGARMIESNVEGWGRIAGYQQQKDYFMNLQRRIEHIDRCAQSPEEKYQLLPNTILYGPPGTGKTRIAKTFASESGIPFYDVNITNVADTYKDGSGKLLQKKINEAVAPIRQGIAKASVIYIDEMNALTRARFQNSNSTEDDKTVDTFLLNSGSENQVPGLIIIGSTNAINVFSDTVINRFPALIEMPEPDVATQAKIIEYFSASYSKGNIRRFGNLDYVTIAESCVHADGKRFVARDIESLFGVILRDVVDRMLDGADYEAGTRDFIRHAGNYAAVKDIKGKLNYT
ncbi:ATP-binding protein [Candidatus Woesearchaeota archaeon]|nr:ATP-binding protein [Candidatus Woesearchaeota archaeon]